MNCNSDTAGSIDRITRIDDQIDDRTLELRTTRIDGLTLCFEINGQFDRGSHQLFE